MNKMLKKAISVVMAAAVAIGGIATTGAKAEAKGSYNAYLMYADSNWNWDGGNNKETVANTKIQGKKGSKTYTVTLNNSKSKNQPAQVFVIDIKGILKNYSAKDIKISGVTVKCDGKKVSGMKAVACGAWEPTEDSEKYRISIYNAVGDNGDKTANYGASYGKKFKFKKSISVTFTVTLKK